MDNASFRSGEVIAGKYLVERLLGEGGMGVVVAARHLELDQTVAVKFLLPEIAKRPDAAERFRREARAAVKIRSEHVARVLDVGTDEQGVPYMVMEYLDGHDLGDELHARGQLPIEEAVSFVLQACEAVAEAHAAGIVHRDLKPANLFLAKRADGTRLIKVLDFGISKSVTGTSSSDLSLTNTSAMIGSPLYMSPEQMHSAKNVDVRTDIWALGAILYQCLANRPPYVADSIPALCSALLNDMPPPLSNARDDVPVALAEVVAKALEKDRTRRWPGVGELARALAPFAPDARVHADRATRMLATTEVLGSATPSTEVSAGQVSASEVSSSGSAAISAERSVMEEQATVADTSGKDRTLDSWGKTGDPSRASVAPRGRRRSIAVAAAGLVVAAIVVAVGISRTTATATPTSAPPPEPPAAAAPAPEPPTPTVAPAETREPTPAPSASVEVAPAKVEPAKPVKTERPSVKHPAPAKSAKPSGLPDFGGRR